MVLWWSWGTKREQQTRLCAHQSFLSWRSGGRRGSVDPLGMLLMVEASNSDVVGAREG